MGRESSPFLGPVSMTGANQLKQLYDVRAAALLLAVSPWTIRAYVRQGRLRPVRLGRLVRFDDEDLQRFVDEAKGEVSAESESMEDTNT
jgi:excisionase family DNA binding protein